LRIPYYIASIGPPKAIHRTPMNRASNAALESYLPTPTCCVPTVTAFDAANRTAPKPELVVAVNDRMLTEAVARYGK
jgi:hypothetical protein